MKIGISIWGICATETDQSDWLPIKKILQKAGHNIVPLKGIDMEVFIALEHYPAPTELAATKVPVSKRILVTFEPRTVNPLMYNLKQRSLYGRVLVPSKQHKISDSEKVYLGGGLSPLDEVTKNLNHFSHRTKAPRTVSLVNENKFSLVPGSLYSLRARTVAKFARAGVEVNLAGANWDKPASWWLDSQAYALLQCLGARQKVDLRLIRWPLRLKSKKIKYAGKVASSVEFQSQFRFAIVIENEATYITEKLFNAIQAGSVPIFCGPSLDDFGIPRDIAVQASTSSRSILRAFKSTSELEAEQIAANGRSWIQSPDTHSRFGHQASFERIGQMLLDEIEAI